MASDKGGIFVRLENETQNWHRGSEIMRQVVALQMSDARDGPYSADRIEPAFSVPVLGPVVAWAFKARVLKAIIRKAKMRRSR